MLIVIESLDERGDTASRGHGSGKSGLRFRLGAIARAEAALAESRRHIQCLPQAQKSSALAVHLSWPAEHARLGVFCPGGGLLPDAQCGLRGRIPVMRPRRSPGNFRSAEFLAGVFLQCPY